MRIAVATFEGMPHEFGGDDRLLVRELERRGAEVTHAPWTDPEVDWSGHELVIARSPWDYSRRHAEFVEWAHSVEAPLENAAELIAWNSDKRYLGDLGEEGLPVVPTTFVGAGDPLPEIDSQVVVKPTISAGARDTGRFGPESARAGLALVERIRERGEVAMVQPFIATVESHGETAIVAIDGRVSHVLHKSPVLKADEVAPVRDDALGAAESMYDPGLVVDGSAEPDQLRLAERTLAVLERRFGDAPLIARVDMLRDEAGDPVLLELEAIEPNLYFEHAPGAAERLADAVIARAR
ncbi:MAG TPA: hypothetical protein VKA36_07665 [Solirubrobacterales bacterium]|nr:hypothetical protein [Solirubrobacterales bacterium]